MVHHGYRRSGFGEIVGDCFGVDFQPYELSNEANVAYAPVIRNAIERLERRLDALENGRITQLSIGSIKKPRAITPSDRDWEYHLKVEISNISRQIKYLQDDESKANQRLETSSSAESKMTCLIS
jgi:hypothetical protein